MRVVASRMAQPASAISAHACVLAASMLHVHQVWPHGSARYIPAFLERQRATGCDIVTGTRYQGGGGVSGWSLSRKIVSRCAGLESFSNWGASPGKMKGPWGRAGEEEGMPVGDVEGWVEKGGMHIPALKIGLAICVVS